MGDENEETDPRDAVEKFLDKYFELRSC